MTIQQAFDTEEQSSALVLCSHKENFPKHSNYNSAFEEKNSQKNKGVVISYRAQEVIKDILNQMGYLPNLPDSKLAEIANNDDCSAVLYSLEEIGHVFKTIAGNVTFGDETARQNWLTGLRDYDGVYSLRAFDEVKTDIQEQQAGSRNDLIHRLYSSVVQHFAKAEAKNN